MRTALILNRASRRGRQWAMQVPELLADRGIQVDERHFPRSGSGLQQAGARVRDGQFPRVIVAGGDGTISSIAKFFAGNETTVGILPLGTGNALARDLELPDNLEQACDILAAGHTRSIDLGFAQGDYFVNVVTAGVSTMIARHLNPDAKRRFGKLAYFAAILRAYREARPFEVTLELDGETHRFQSLQVVVGCGRYHAGPFPLSKGASILDGKLDVYALRSTDRRDLIELARRLAKGDQASMENLLSLQASAGRLATTPSVRGTMDGEITLRTPFDFRVEPAAMRVLVPESLAV